MNCTKKNFLFSLLIFFSLTLYAELPGGYRNIHLGMSLGETKEALLKDSSFGYHGDRDVSLVPGSNTTLIETDAGTYGLGFLDRCWFQFTQDTLYTITININTNKMDYFSVFTTLKDKYGEPDSFDPQKAVWKDDSYTMTLEKPLTIKYIDNEIFDSLQNYSTIEKSSAEITRQMFLDEL